MLQLPSEFRIDRASLDFFPNASRVEGMATYPQTLLFLLVAHLSSMVYK
jgi:hypothetical protein